MSEVVTAGGVHTAKPIIWRMFLSVGATARQVDFPTWELAAEAALKVANRMTETKKMQAGGLDMLTASIQGYTERRTIAMGGWAAASYTPEWRIAIIPQNALGIDPEEVREDVSLD